LKKRLAFHLLHLAVVVAAVVLAVFLYHLPRIHEFSALLQRSLRFIRFRLPNLGLMAGLTYVMIYISGLSYAERRGGRRFNLYINTLVKLVLILGMVSFLEFFLFFSTKVGRLIYIYVFFLMALFYLFKFMSRPSRERADILWLSRRPPEEFLRQYPALAAKYHPVLADNGDIPAPACEIVVYQRSELDEKTAERLIRSKLSGRRVVDLNRLVEQEEERLSLQTVSLDWLMEELNRTQRHYLRASYWLNMLLASLLLALLWLPAWSLALLHRLVSPGPVFYTQTRLGLNQRSFRVFKFRSMPPHAERGGARFAPPRDPRLNMLGRLMRRFRLDEVPQLWNVLRGEMNLVGPRPEREVFIRNLSRKLPFYRLRLLVKPGLTGWAQVKMGYAGDDIDQQRRKLEYDLFYVKNRSLLLDLLILIKTLPVVFRGQGR
jgi:lipopolysaccharide/colanic/teichoic acid biosynthesis glycosyltransferase